MKCAECPVSLVCYAGQLDSEARITLCIKCGRIEFLPPGSTLEIHQLRCEERQLTKEMTAAYYAKLHPQLDMQTHLTLEGRSHPHIIAEVPWPDTGPGLIHKEFRLRFCFTCEPPNTRNTFNIRDLDATKQAEQEAKPHVFELKGARR